MVDVALQREQRPQLTFTVGSEDLGHANFSMQIVVLMRLLLVIPAMIIAAPFGAPLAAAGPNAVHGLAAAGEILPFEVIRDRVIASVRGEYVGAEFDSQSRTYRFRFVNDGTLFNVDVDARTGERVSRRQRF